MTGGMDDFARWLTDLARSGTASARHQPYTWWDGTAARLVDAQLPGLADDVRSVGGVVNGRPDWADRLLVALGRWWTATRAWAARESLAAAQLGDLRAYLGWTTSRESVRRGDAVADRWVVLGRTAPTTAVLQQQRTWLRGHSTGETVQVLDFAAGGQVLPVRASSGRPSTRPSRGIPVPLSGVPCSSTSRWSPAEAGRMPSGSGLEEAHSVAAAVLGRNPWARRCPVVLEDVRISRDRVVDSGGKSVALADDADVWSLLALTGGRPTRLFGELEETRLRPLTVVLDGEVVGL